MLEVLNNTRKPDINLVKHLLLSNINQYRNISEFSQFKEMVEIFAYIRNKIPQFFKYFSMENGLFLRAARQYMYD